MSISSQQRILRPPKPRLVYPGVAPSFNSAHPAARNCVLSAFANGGTFIDLLTGRAGTPANTPTAQMRGTIGPAVGFVTASAHNVAISGKRSYGSNAAPLTDTMACIAIMNSSAAQQGFLALGTNGTDTNYSWMGTAASTVALGVAHAGLAMPTITSSIAVNTPFFFAVSQSLSAATAATQTYVGVAVNLLTGQIYTGSGSQGAFSVGARNGTYNIGSRGGGSLPAAASIACVMASDSFTSLPELVKWAADPWSFWYPK